MNTKLAQYLTFGKTAQVPMPASRPMPSVNPYTDPVQRPAPAPMPTPAMPQQAQAPMAPRTLNIPGQR